MPIELALWRMDRDLTRIQPTTLALEESLEQALLSDLSLIQSNLLLVGHQIATPYGGRVDVLALDGDGDLVIVELKRDRTPREIVAQLLDYGSWAEGLSYEDVSELFAKQHPDEQLDRRFAEVFGINLPEEIARRHRLVIVCAQLDSSTERIVGYLNDSYGVPINAVFFQHFQDGDRKYLARSWLIDPSEAEVKSFSKKRAPWNGRDFYISFGESDRRRWADAKRYGFVSGGGGRWYSQPLTNLNVDNRVFVHVPKQGYVGVVTSEAVPISDFFVEQSGRRERLLDLPLRATGMADQKDDPALAEWVVGVEWLSVRDLDAAY